MKDELIDTNQINEKENNEILDYQYQQITKGLGFENVEGPLISPERWAEMVEFEKEQDIRADVEADLRREYERENE